MNLVFPGQLTDGFARIGFLENLELERAGELTTFQSRGGLLVQKEA